jgi:serine/threonine protein kinase
MRPEPRPFTPQKVMRSNELGRASDVYSFGMVMYEALTWRLPWFNKKSPQARLHMGALRTFLVEALLLCWCVLN